MERGNESSEIRTIKKRAVCYIPGYDPRGPKFYHRMFKRESAKQGKVSGYEVTAGKIEVVNDRVSRWKAEHRSAEGEVTEIDYISFNYDNMIKEKWEKSTFKIYLSLIRMAWVYISNGYLLKGWKMGQWTMLTIFLPVLVGLIQLLLVILSAYLVFSEPSWHWGLKLGAFAALIGLVCWSGIAIENRFSLNWLTRTGRFFTYHKYSNLPEIKAMFRHQLLALDQSDEYDEIILVGHSMGTVLAAEVMDEALQADADFANRSAEVNLLTLGSVIGMIAGVNSNQALIESLRRLKDETRIDWIEFSAKADGANVFMKHPLCLQGAGQEKSRLPRFQPARFFKSNSPEVYKALLDDRLRLHFQYILAQELAGEYDYFNMIAGAHFLRDLFPEAE